MFAKRIIEAAVTFGLVAGGLYLYISGERLRFVSDGEQVVSDSYFAGAETLAEIVPGLVLAHAETRQRLREALEAAEELRGE